MVRAALTAALLAASSPAVAGDRLAIVIGDDTGDRDEVTLRYARTDADRVAGALRAGGFAAEDVLVLGDASAADVRRVLTANRSPHALVLVFYSGHGDAESLHLGGTRLPIAELRDLVAAMPATIHVLVVDACRSGALTRVKGGRAAPSFVVHVDPDPAEGTALLTSSAAGEDSQESDALRASFFTHHFVSALLGAADADRDGQITVDEAFSYAASRTVAATASSIDGPQHPTYRVELAGRHHVVLTRPGAAATTGTVELADPGRWLVQRGDDTGPVVAEIVAEDGGRRVSVEAGRYSVTLRQPARLLQGAIVVTARDALTVSTHDLHAIDYARVVRKGGSARRTAWSAFALGGVRGDLLDLGMPLRVRGGARVDTATLAFELRATLGASSVTNPRHTTWTGESSLALAATRVIDRGRLAFGLGLLAGGGMIAQRFFAPARQPSTIPPEPAHDSAFALFAPLAALDVTATHRSYVRLEASAPTYLLREAGPTAHLTWELGAGLGVFF
jgi:hypothetical protein